MKLKRFRELEFYGNHNLFIRLIERIEEKLSDEWSRSREDENHIVNNLSSVPYCFRCIKSSERESALLWMMEKYYETPSKDYQTLYVANIVPIEQQQLDYDQYNYILNEFYERFAQSAANELQIESKLTPDEEGIDNWFSPIVEEKLTKFSRLANKNTGNSHPSDEQRWLDFIVTSHQNNSSISSEILQRWLTEIEKWSDEVSWNLVSEYESARKLLEFYDNERYDK